MTPYIILIRYGLHIDERSKSPWPCPKCGTKSVCFVKENETEVFCTNPLCSFHDHVDLSYIEDRIKRFEYMKDFPPVFFYPNDKFNAKIPFITTKDVKDGNFIIREFEFDYDMKRKQTQYGGGWEMSHKDNCRIVAQYSTLVDMCIDGWLVNKDPQEP